MLQKIGRVATSSPGDLPKPGIKAGSPALGADSLLSEAPGKPSEFWTHLGDARAEEL